MGIGKGLDTPEALDISIVHQRNFHISVSGCGLREIQEDNILNMVMSKVLTYCSLTIRRWNNLGVKVNNFCFPLYHFMIDPNALAGT